MVELDSEEKQKRIDRLMEHTKEEGRFLCTYKSFLLNYFKFIAAMKFLVELNTVF